MEQKSRVSPSIRLLLTIFPAPPQRKTGYREKQFDKLAAYVLGLGFEIINIQTQSHNGVNQSGFWVMFTLKPLTKEAREFDLDEDFELELEPEDSIEGLYQIED